MTELKDRMLETEMEDYLEENDYDLLSDGAYDSANVFEHAENLGFEQYKLVSTFNGLNDTYFFIKNYKN